MKIGSRDFIAFFATQICCETRHRRGGGHWMGRKGSCTFETFSFLARKKLEMFTRLFHIWTSIDRNSSRRYIVESTLKSQREKWFRPEPDFIFHFGDYARMESHLPSRNKGAGSGKRLFLPLTEHHANGASRMSTLESVKSFLRSKRKDFSPNFT